ncbi:helix-turn-helix domain-containing protein [Marinigracilibium pacificum]|uniref:Helix-turn-helix domain-containing protein n=1 Tax=Marinigracilibium pacificum TaxID=2729599 RepID=A0A848IZH0_9BACT|nr:helix-turn-helix domain-containing protein [Marinigracilibium pacificum]NMM48685.1 helix-turn-helix domain-containing protein [Marinigracilibium pacificum]
MQCTRLTKSHITTANNAIVGLNVKLFDIIVKKIEHILKKFKVFGENLKKLRKAKGLSQDEFATLLNDSAGIHFKRHTISNYETGVSYPSLDLVPHIARILDVSIDTMLGVKVGEGVVSIESEEDLIPNDSLSTEMILSMAQMAHAQPLTPGGLSREQLERLFNRFQQVNDQLVKEVVRLRDENINLKDRMISLQEKIATIIEKEL